MKAQEANAQRQGLIPAPASGDASELVEIRINA